MFCVCVIYVNGHEVADSSTDFAYILYLLKKRVLFYNENGSKNKRQTKNPHKLCISRQQELAERKKKSKNSAAVEHTMTKKEREKRTVSVFVVILAAPNESHFRFIQAILQGDFSFMLNDTIIILMYCAHRKSESDSEE